MSLQSFCGAVKLPGRIAMSHLEPNNQHPHEQSADHVKRMLIRDAINGAARARARNDLFIYSLTDYLHLWIQQPACITFWKSEKGVNRPIFFSFLDPQVMSHQILNVGPEIPQGEMRKRFSLGDDEYAVTVHSVNRDEASLTFNQTWTNRLPTLWSEQEDDPIRVDFGPHMVETLSKLANASKRQPQQSIDPASIRNPEDTGLLTTSRERLAEAIDRVFNTLHDSQLLHVSKGELPCINLFAVFRWVQSVRLRCNGLFPYTAAIRLTPNQESEIWKWLRRKVEKGDQATTEFLKHYQDWPIWMQHPLGDADRAVFDSIVAAGFLEIGLPGKRGEAASGWRDRATTYPKRQDVETFVYSELLRELLASGAPSDPEREIVLLYVPVHVGGSPWLCFFTFAFAGEDGWFQHYHLYRDVLSPTNDRLRRELESVFFKMAAETFQPVLQATDVPAKVREANDNMRSLAQIFPYDLVQFTTVLPEGERSYQVDLPGGGALFLIPRDNPYHPKHVDYELLDMERLKQELNLHAVEEAASRARRNAELAESVYAVGHPLKNRFARAKQRVMQAKAQIMNNPPEIDFAKSWLQLAEQHIESAIATGAVMDLLARVCSAGGSVGNLDKRFYSSQPFHFGARVAEVIHELAAGGETLYVQDEDLLTIASCRVSAWMTTSRGRQRLFDTFYDDIIFELLINAFLNAPISSKRLKCGTESIALDGDKSLQFLTFCNPTTESDENEFVQRLKLRPNHWSKWDTSSGGPRGGLRLLANQLSFTSAGVLVAKPYKCDDKWWFAIALHLEGMEIENE
jgi:hypothetical protein